MQVISGQKLWQSQKSADEYYLSFGQHNFEWRNARGTKTFTKTSIHTYMAVLKKKMHLHFCISLSLSLSLSPSFCLKSLRNMSCVNLFAYVQTCSMFNQASRSRSMSTSLQILHPLENIPISFIPPHRTPIKIIFVLLRSNYVYIKESETHPWLSSLFL